MKNAVRNDIVSNHQFRANDTTCTPGHVVRTFTQNMTLKFRSFLKIVGAVLAVVAVCFLGFFGYLAYLALKCEERLIALASTVKLTENFLKQHHGQWPQSWDDLDNTPQAENYPYSTQETKVRLRALVEVDFSQKAEEIAKSTPASFSAVRPLGPCATGSFLYLRPVAELIETAKELTRENRGETATPTSE